MSPVGTTRNPCGETLIGPPGTTLAVSDLTGTCAECGCAWAVNPVTWLGSVTAPDDLRGAAVQVCEHGTCRSCTCPACRSVQLRRAEDLGACSRCHGVDFCGHARHCTACDLWVACGGTHETTCGECGVVGPCGAVPVTATEVDAEATYHTSGCSWLWSKRERARLL